ncbi:MAG: dihydrofolate reductase family protein [Saprospiraceae bacterium]|nr:dihydrofolate reductase family protein [Saprospiraceae bacterium]MCB0669926.1 dihydrofolate reductase family protein [Saprospiraceae bacterium]MCB9321009.1 dihydrofolate reductase family protein [Lewinellaceae bacterium]
MRKIIVLSMITLDGVIQSPGSPQEDPSDGFRYGGWVAPFSDEVYGKVVQEELRPADYLLGRKTYEIWAGYWPQHGAFWPGINEGTKYVFSKNLKKKDPLVTGWRNSVVIRTVADIKKLKSLPTENQGSKSGDIQVWGSSELVRLLLKNDLVDELRLKIHPVILGKGKKLFDQGSVPVTYTLVDSRVTSTGVIIAHYQRTGNIKTGTIEA